MKNPLTATVESYMVSVMVLLFSIFLIGLLLLAIKNFNTDNAIISEAVNRSLIKTISPQERVLIDDWIMENDINLSVREVGYRYIVETFPDKPWR